VDGLLEDLPVDRVLLVLGLGVGDVGGPDPADRGVRVNPAGLVAAREAYDQPTLQHMVQRRDLLRDADRVVRGQDVAQDPGGHPLGMRPDEQAIPCGVPEVGLSS
jgi:hypothetical protein